MCVCVCVCVRECERERESVCVWVCECVSVWVCGCAECVSVALVVPAHDDVRDLDQGLGFMVQGLGPPVRVCMSAPSNLRVRARKVGSATSALVVPAHNDVRDLSE